MKLLRDVTKVLSCVSCFTAAILAHADELLDQNDFNNGIAAPWELYAHTPNNAAADTDVINGKYVVHLKNGGTEIDDGNRWNLQVRHRGLTMENGHTYTVKFKARASKATKLYAKIGGQSAPHTEYWNNNWQPISLPINTWVEVNETFTMSETTASNCEFGLYFGGDLIGSVPIDVELDDIYLEESETSTPPDSTDPSDNLDAFGALVRVNQVGYFPNGKKRATVLTTSTSPLNWTLKDSTGASVATGTTSVYGNDDASGDHVHQIDFSTFTSNGTGYVLAVDEGGKELSSHPFDIRENLYSQMKYDALAYFYHNRSGIEIEMPYAGRTDLTRPAGHKPDVMATWPGSGQQDYSLDISKGWYDAGDHGKYAVNGGISVWTMMNQYERTLHIQGADKSALADGAMNIPEKSNGYPDILDEARWEMDMLLAMQVPDDKNFAGMVHHKGHDNGWTGLPLAPHEDTKTRNLKPVSTAATLNLVAAAAQSARLWKGIDETFSLKCLDAAVKGWNAAKANPAIYAPNNGGDGGGPYADENVEDEFYWAACELFVTTGDDEYRNYISSSPFFLKISPTFTPSSTKLQGVCSWMSTNALGTISLALVPNDLSDTEIEMARTSIADVADFFLKAIDREGYLLPMEPDDGKYVWGSNSVLLNDMIVIALAYDFTKNKAYFDGVSEAMDYLLGRNAMDQSYVTGYGERPLMNPHHRFWANQLNNAYPLAPAGVVSGGPNSGLEDGFSSARLSGRKPQKCFIDNIEAWSTNEITINWNAPFAWITGFLDENKEINVDITAQQEITLQQGVNLIALTVSPEDASVDSLFADYKENISYVRSFDGLHFREVGSKWVNSIGNWNMNQGYVVRANKAFTMTVEGVAYVQSQPLSLKKGFNLLPYTGESKDAEVVLADIMGNVDHVIYDKDHVLLNNNGSISNGIGSFEPGRAYMIYMKDDDSTSLAADSVTVRTGDWLYANGKNILNADGKPVWLTGANWYGFNVGSNTFDGLWASNMKSSLNSIADRGLNILRLPISTELLNNWKNGIYPMPTNINESQNPSLAGKNSLEVFDIVLAHCETIGLKILLDVHSPKSEAQGHEATVWYKDEITPQIFIDAWLWVADRYKNNDTIVAFDLENEPHGGPTNHSTMARWDGSDHINNWKKVAQDLGRAIHAVHPKALILVEGVEVYPVAGKTYASTNPGDYYYNWWGGNLRGVKDYPIDLGAGQNQLVYSIHDYGPGEFAQPWFNKAFTKQTVYEDCWRDNWAYIMEDNIAPVFIGEWGGVMDHGDNQKWMEIIRDYIKENFIHHTFWCFNYVPVGTGGLLTDDYTTWDEERYGLLKQTLWQDTSGRFVGLDRETPLGSNGVTVTDYYSNGGAAPVK